MSDYNKNIEPFLEGESNIEDTNLNGNSDYDADFIKTYKKVIDETNNEQLPDFNPFAKIPESDKKRRPNIFRRLLPFAATVLLLVGAFSIFTYLNSQQKPVNNYSEKEIAEIRENTEYALLCFSKEFNNSLKKFEDVQQLSQPFEEIQKLKDVKIEFNNPIKNLKFN